MKNKLQRRQEGIKRARKVLRVWRSRNFAFGLDEYYQYGGKCERGLIKTRKACSCYMCGHRRELDGDTRKEIISKQEMQYEISNLGE